MRIELESVRHAQGDVPEKMHHVSILEINLDQSPANFLKLWPWKIVDELHHHPEGKIDLQMPSG